MGIKLQQTEERRNGDKERNRLSGGGGKARWASVRMTGVTLKRGL